MNDFILHYVLTNISLVYQFPEDIISYGNNPRKVIHVSTTNRELTRESISSPARKTWKDQTIPFLFDTDTQQEIITKNEDGVTINYDILSSIFYLLSGKQEIECQQKDHHGRFEWKNSLQKELGITEIPLVNYYYDILIEAYSIATGKSLLPKHTFQIALTHDIDEVQSAWKHRIRINLSNKNFFKAVSSYISHLFKPFYPWRNLMEIAQLENSYDATSTFFFLTNNKRIEEIKNADYLLSDTYIKKTLVQLRNNNNEIGIHGAYRTHDSTKNFKEGLRHLDRVKGNRFHFLQFDMAQSPQIIEQNGLRYDSTLGFQEHIGFRNSCCTPFYLYNFNVQKAYDFLEIPLSIMDCSMAFKEYMNTSAEESDHNIDSLLAEIKKWNGVAVFNWHNTFVNDYTNQEWKKSYIRLLEKIKQEKIHCQTLEEVTTQFLN